MQEKYIFNTKGIGWYNGGRYFFVTFKAAQGQIVDRSVEDSIIVRSTRKYDFTRTFSACVLFLSTLLSLGYFRLLKAKHQYVKSKHKGFVATMQL